MASQSQQDSAPENRTGTEETGEETMTGERVDENTADPTATPESTDPALLEAALNDARQKAQEYWEKLVRQQAEMDNLRKRTSRDVEQAHKYALEKFVSELLPVIDSLELGINAAQGEDESEDNTESLREGMELTLKKFLDVMAKFGVQPIDPLGEKFNPELHEAVSMQESPEASSNTVITVMQKGYTLNERLVRPAMVVVAK